MNNIFHDEKMSGLTIQGSVCVSGVILHEEHIELLTEDFKELKRQVEGKLLQEGTLHFTGKRQECVSEEYF